MLSDEKIIQGCRKGKRKSQKLLYEKFNKKLFVVCMRYSRGRLDAEDILQDAFVNIYANIAKFRQDCPLEQWMKRIVVNTALKHYRSRIHQYPPYDVDQLEDQLPDQEFTLSNFNFKELLAMIQKLPERCQVVFNLFAIEGYQHNEIAEMLEISTGTSKSQFSRAKVLLQEMIRKNEAFDYEPYSK